MNYIDEIAQAIRARVDPGYQLPKTDIQRLFRMYAVLALVKGIGVTAKDVHDAWSAWECDRKPRAPRCSSVPLCWNRFAAAAVPRMQAYLRRAPGSGATL
jgi:hypothetical protein